MKKQINLGSGSLTKNHSNDLKSKVVKGSKKSCQSAARPIINVRNKT